MVATSRVSVATHIEGFLEAVAGLELDPAIRVAIGRLLDGLFDDRLVDLRQASGIQHGQGQA